jgi:hypothetical protein
MGRGEPINNFRNGLYSYWDMDGRILSTTIPDRQFKLPLTVIDGPPAWDLDSGSIHGSHPTMATFKAAAGGSTGTLGYLRPNRMRPRIFAPGHAR